MEMGPCGGWPLHKGRQEAEGDEDMNQVCNSPQMCTPSSPCLPAKPFQKVRL